MGVIEFSLRRRVTVSMAAVALGLFGAVAFTRLPINLLPDISYPSMTIETRYPGAAPAEVESLVSRPVEEAVGVVAGVRRLTSVSRPGLSQVVLEFDWDREMDFASLDVREKLDMVVLPKEAVKPVLLRFDPANDPVMRLYLTGGQSLYQLRYVADEVLKKDLESTEGVAAIKVNGGYEEEIQVRVDQGKLALLGISIQEVNQKLQRENVNQAGGSLYESEARYLVRARNEFEGLQDIKDTVLVSREGRNVLISDVAEVTRGHKLRDVITRFGGREAVELALYKEGDANTVSVARAISTRLERVRSELPAGIEAVTGVDQSRFIRASIREVLFNALLGGLIAVVVLLLFLKDLVSTLIIGLSIPVSIIATFFLMYETGTTLNVMSLGGLALGVGMLVDNAIVVLEAIHKRRESGETGLEAARGGASEVGRAVVASTLTTVAVFLPVVFVEGVAAQLFRDQALTVSFSLLASLAVSLTIIPMLAALRSHVLPSGPATAAGIAGAPAGDGGASVRGGRYGAPRFGSPLTVSLRGLRVAASWLLRRLAGLCRPLTFLFDRVLGGVTDAYPGLLRAALQARWTVLAFALLAFAGALVAGRGLGVDLIPAFSEGEFSFRVELPEGTPLEATDHFVTGVQDVLTGDPRIASCSSVIGGAGISLSNTGTEGENTARIQVLMREGSTRGDEEKVAALLRARLETSGEARFKFERPSVFTLRTPIEVEVYGEDLDELQMSAAAVKKRLQEVRGLVDVRSSLETGNPELRVSFNRQQLGQLGLNLFDVAETVRGKVQGEVATRFLEGDREIDIRVRSVEAGAASADDVRDMIIGQRDGLPIHLKSIADVRLGEGPSEVRRIGQKRAAVVSGNLSGRDMGAVAADVRSILRALPLPLGVTADLSGQEEEMGRAFRSLLMALALAIFLVYLVMASQFESLLHPFVVMFSVPLGAIGVVIALAVTGTSLNVVALIGVVMLAGIVVNNAIILVDSVNQIRARGVPRDEALVLAGQQRLRPILMTSATTILGLLPMAIGLGEGAELRAPLAITVIGGLTVATVLTLIVIPVVYSLLDRKAYATSAAAAPVPGAPAAGPASADRRPAAAPAPGFAPVPALAVEPERGLAGGLPLRRDTGDRPEAGE